MSSTTLYRLSGLALLLALPIQIVGWILHPAGERLSDLLSPLQGPAHVIMFCSWRCSSPGRARQEFPHRPAPPRQPGGHGGRPLPIPLGDAFATAEARLCQHLP
jgi:hypothetical protein